MGDEINITGGIQAGAMNVGGSGNTVESGTLNVLPAAAGQLAQLRALLNDLVALTGQPGVPPQAHTAATDAAAEADLADADLGRIRQLMNTVRAVAGKAGPVANAAANIINIISGIQNLLH